MNYLSATLQTRRTFPFLFLCLFALLFEGQANAQESDNASIVTFSLKDHQGESWSLDECDKELVVVAFMGTECPLAKLYASRLQKIADENSEKTAFVFLNSNQQDSLAELAHFVRTYDLTIPFLKDPGNEVADLLKAERTPQVFLLDGQRKIRYSGKIDDQYTYGIQRAKADNHFLKTAIKSLLEGRQVELSKTEPVGCLIGRVFKANESQQVTFANQVSRILNKNCVSCHRKGQIGPFELTDYDEVVGWAGMIAEVVGENRMPPWHASDEIGEFANDSRLSEDEKTLIKTWVENGAPLGDIAGMPEPPTFAKDWQIGQPDVIVKMREKPFKVPASGTVSYKYFVVDPGFKEDKWVKAAECRAGAAEVVHHIIVGVSGQGEFNENRRNRGVHDDLDSEWIAATAPGAPPLVLPDGYAKFIPAGSKLIFQMHYTPNGTAQEDISQIGLVFAKPEEVKKRVYTQQVHNARLEIKPGDSNYRVQGREKFEKDVELLTMFPHMHYRGKYFKFELKQPGGKFNALLEVPHYDFNWQNSYVLKDRLDVAAGSIMLCTAVFDNSEKNLANPDPSKTVRWGDQTWDEMMIGYFDVAIDVEPESNVPGNR